MTKEKFFQINREEGVSEEYMRRLWARRPRGFDADESDAMEIAVRTAAAVVSLLLRQAISAQTMPKGDVLLN